MRNNPVAALILSAILGAAMCGPARSADGARSRIYVHVNNLTADDARVSDFKGIIVDAVELARLRAMYARISDSYGVMRRALPDFDIASAIRTSLRCLPSPSAAEDCRDVTLYQGASKQPDATPGPTSGIVTNVDLIIEFRQPYPAMILEFTLTERDADDPQKISKEFKFRYLESVDDPDNAWPFADPASASLSASETRARSYWFDGHPSRFETTVRAALQDFRDFTAFYYDRAGRFTDDPSRAPWWGTLPKTGELKDKGLLNCHMLACRRPYFRVQNGRMWYIPESKGSPQIFESDPLTAWGGHAATVPERGASGNGH